MQDMARDYGGRAMMAQALWLEGLAIYPKNARVGMEQLETALHYTEAWRVSLKTDRPTASWWQNTILRDQVLASILLLNHGQCDKAFVMSRAHFYANNFEGQDNLTANDFATNQEVRAKAAIATGDLQAAERLLFQALSSSQYVHLPDMEVKMLGLCAELAIAQGRTSEAEEKLSKAIELADRHAFVHYQLYFRTLAHNL